MSTFGSTFRGTFCGTLRSRAATPSLLIGLFALASACGESSNGPSAPTVVSSSRPANAPASAPASTPEGASPSEPTPSSSGLVLVPLATYEGSGQAVHPDGATTPAGWSFTTAHAVATPYPNGNARVENPSYYDVQSASSWTPPVDEPNPLAMPVPGAHLSDPDMLYDPDTRLLWVYYREVTDSNLIHLIRSADGTHWTAPVTVLAVPRHFAISPAVVRRGPGDWLMWTVNGGREGCSAQATTVELRHSADGLTWGRPEPVRIGSGATTPWHIDVEWVPSRHEFWGVYNAKRPGSCMTEVVRFVTSADGVSWTEYPSPLLRAGAIPEFADVVYRSSIAYDSTTEAVTVLYSGARAVDSVYTWKVATEQIDRRALMARITAISVPTASHARLRHGAHGARERRVPELTNETAP